MGGIGIGANTLLDPDLVSEGMGQIVESTKQEPLHLTVWLSWRGAVYDPSGDVFRVGFKSRVQIILRLAPGVRSPFAKPFLTVDLQPVIALARAHTRNYAAR